MKFFIVILLMISINLKAESSCDVRPGKSIGIDVIEFVSGQKVLSKMTLRESSPRALLDEMTELQDMGDCGEKVVIRKCVLKYEKQKKVNVLTLYRNGMKWSSWNLHLKNKAQNYIKGLKKAGFC